MKAKDRARAESGLIFRDGKLVNKEDWYMAHPTREMLAQPTDTADMEAKRIIWNQRLAERVIRRKRNRVVS